MVKYVRAWSIARPVVSRTANDMDCGLHEEYLKHDGYGQPNIACAGLQQGSIFIVQTADVSYPHAL